MCSHIIHGLLFIHSPFVVRCSQSAAHSERHLVWLVEYAALYACGARNALSPLHRQCLSLSPDFSLSVAIPLTLNWRRYYWPPLRSFTHKFASLWLSILSAMRRLPAACAIFSLDCVWSLTRLFTEAAAKKPRPKRSLDEHMSLHTSIRWLEHVFYSPTHACGHQHMFDWRHRTMCTINTRACTHVLVVCGECIDKRPHTYTMNSTFVYICRKRTEPYRGFIVLCAACVYAVCTLSIDTHTRTHRRTARKGPIRKNIQTIK